MDANEFYEYIAKLRIERNLTERGFNIKAGLSNSYLGSMKKQQNLPNINTLETICETLGVSMADFFLGMENRDPMLALAVSSCVDLFPSLSEDEKRFYARFLGRLTPGLIRSMKTFFDHMDGIQEDK